MTDSLASLSFYYMLVGFVHGLFRALIAFTRHYGNLGRLSSHSSQAIAITYQCSRLQPQLVLKHESCLMTKIILFEIS